MMELKVNGTVCHSIGELRQAATAATAAFVEEYLDDTPSVDAHTSGSTGAPKPIKLAKSDMRASARLTNEFFGIGSQSVLYLPLSPDYIAGKMMIVRAIEAGATLYDEQPSNQPLAHYAGPPIDLIAVVPSQLGFLINSPGLLDNIKTMIIGGGQLPQRIERWLAERGVNAYKTYGMTETCSHIALSPVAAACNEPYTALGDVTFELDGRGCLVVRLPHLSVGEIVTNDIVELHDNRHFTWLGRIDNVINTGGIKVYPEVVEATIAKLLPRLRFFVTSCDSDKWGEEVVLALEYPSLPAGTVKEGTVMPALVEQMKKVLPAASVPRRYVAVKQFATTASGKIVRWRGTPPVMASATQAPEK